MGKITKIEFICDCMKGDLDERVLDVESWDYVEQRFLDRTCLHCGQRCWVKYHR